jgi:hypothetical protein
MSVISGIAGAQASDRASKKSANASTQAAQISADALLEMFNKNLSLQQPYHKAGVGALGELQGGSVDPTGGAGQYQSQLEGLDLNLPEFDYSFDPEDPAYKFKLEESQKAIDKAAAARGNYNSRAAINQISESQRAITADEVNSQFNRAKDIYGIDTSRMIQDYNTDYGRTMDLYNMASKLGGTDYQSLIDLVKIGQGSAAAAGSGATATGQGLASTYSNMGNALAANYANMGRTQADLYSGIGASAINAGTAYALSNNSSNQGVLGGILGSGAGSKALPADWANYVI